MMHMLHDPCTDTCMDSPVMNTPFLDMSMDTPYMDGSVNTPYYDNGSDTSPYVMYTPPFDINTYVNSMAIPVKDTKDICIANYLQQEERTHDPIAEFNGDPTQLLIDKSKSPCLNKDESNSLFPPLLFNHSNHPYAYHQSLMHGFEDLSLDEILGFDASSPSTEACTLADVSSPFTDVCSSFTDVSSPSSDASSSTYTDVNSSNELRKRNTTIQQKGRIIHSRRKLNAKKYATSSDKEKQYKCPLCPLVSKRRYNLTTHMKTHDRNRIKEFACSQCHKCFDRRHDRDRHLATVHRGERSYVCTHCSTHFSRRDGLNRHLIQRHDYTESELD
ncbi:hypothetical protein BDB01DRAFT_778998 [Pilobolus umbonatus]|nr:hypothetical protein BDB01DRAFT_778998 [Pilobolus umbonatus]